MSDRIYTCATEGCGKPIHWRDSHWWVHSNGGWRDCRSLNKSLPLFSLAHPAEGTNTTPPEELERDVTELYEILEYVGDYCEADAGQVSDLSRMIRAYCHQETERQRVTIKNFSDTLEEERLSSRAEVADLRDQLDRTLVPKFKVGDTVLHTEWGEEVTITEPPVICYSVEDLLVFEEHLAPLETECQHETHRWLDPNGDGFLGRKVPNNNCPKCGASLTKEGS